MSGSEVIALERDCAAVLVPSGVSVVLAEGERVVVRQRLGGSVTVETPRGGLARIDARDADALGIDGLAVAPDPRTGKEVVTVERVLEALRNVYDPEIPINVVDLGLIYRCELFPLEQVGLRVEVDMSMTAPGCGMGDVLKRDAAEHVRSLPGVADVAVEVVFDPPWGLDRLSESARLTLGMW